MKPTRLLPWVLCFACLSGAESVEVLSGPQQARSGKAPVNIILDTDIGPDCDDVGAVCLLHGLADRGEATILGMMCCTSCAWGAPCLDALNTYYGRPDIPVGTLKDEGFLAGAGYNRVIAQQYPHRLRSGKDVPDATELYRRILAGQPDGSVVIVAIGPLRNLGKLLDSGPDRHSNLDGVTLVARKVKLLTSMGGWYPKAPEGGGPEFNFQQDAKAARNVAERWPSPITFSGAEIGSGIMTGRRVAVDASEYNPLTLAFALSADVGFGADRASWDETAVLYGVRGAHPYWSTSPSGYNRVGARGGNTFTEEKDRKHRFLVPRKPVSELEDVLEDLMAGAREGLVHLDFNIARYAQDGMGAVTAQDESLPNGKRMHAFDRDPESVWIAQRPESWIAYQCPDGKKYVVSKYRITTAHAAAENAPHRWALSGSNDGGKTWSLLDRRRGEKFLGRGQTREFVFDNRAAFNLYRVQFSAAASAHIAGIELLERIQQEMAVKVTDVRLDAARLEIPVAGRSALNVSVMPVNAGDSRVTWHSSDDRVATVKRIGKNTAIVCGRSPGSCTVRATTRQGERIATCAIEVTESTLPKPWAYQEINSPAVPGCAVYQDGAFTVTGGGQAIERWWQRIHDQFSYVSQNKRGGREITARIVSQTPSSPRASAGLMFRESNDRDSRFVFLGVSPSQEVFLTWRDGPDDEGPRKLLGKFELPLHLKLRRSGSSFEAFLSRDGVSWGKPQATHTSKAFPADLMIGMCVNGHNNPTTSTAIFDHVLVQESR